jgi:hypothetical protein
MKKKAPAKRRPAKATKKPAKKTQKQTAKKTAKPETPETIRVDDVIDRGTYSRPFPTQEPIKK